MRDIDYKNFEIIFWSEKSYILLYIILVITIMIGPKIGDFEHQLKIKQI